MRLTKAGIEMYAIGEADDEQMWSYYCEQRRKGRKATEIGTPRETVPLMGGTAPAPMLWLTEPIMNKDGTCAQAGKIMAGYFEEEAQVTEPVAADTEAVEVVHAVKAVQPPPAPLINPPPVSEPELEPELQLFYPDEIEGNQERAREAQVLAAKSANPTLTPAKKINAPKAAAKSRARPSVTPQTAEYIALEAIEPKTASKFDLFARVLDVEDLPQ